jgi:hypothetical protein
MNDVIRHFLERLRQVGSEALDERVRTIDRARAGLERQAATNEPSVRLALGQLRRCRLLASNTLRRRAAAERRAWDAANQWIGLRLMRRHAASPFFSIEELTTLNGLIVGGSSSLREHEVVACGRTFLTAEHVAEELRLHLDWARGTDRHPLVCASAIYSGIVTIHPFANGNGRTARLAADALLLAHGYLPLYFRSSIASHAAQTQDPENRLDPERTVYSVLAWMLEGYRLVTRDATGQAA